MASRESRWQVRVGPADGCGPGALERALTIAPWTEGYVVDGALTVYVESLEVARAIVAAQDTEVVSWADISVWAPDSGLWRPVEHVGDSSVALYQWEIAKSKSEYSKSLRDFRFGVPAAIGGFGTVAFLIVYLIGGGAGSSVGDRNHSVLAAAIVACCAMIAVGVKVRR